MRMSNLYLIVAFPGCLRLRLPVRHKQIRKGHAYVHKRRIYTEYVRGGMSGTTFSQLV